MFMCRPNFIIIPRVREVLATQAATVVNIYVSIVVFLMHFSTLSQPIKEADTP